MSEHEARIVRLRDAPSSDELATMYATPHDHRLYGRGHGERVEATIALARGLLDARERMSVADLSCGNGEIATRIATVSARLGDIAPGYEYHGPIEETIRRLPHVDVFVLSETAEHLDNPYSVLADIAERADYLVMSTPLDCWDDTNTEHVWAWNFAGVETLLDLAGWRSIGYTFVDSRTYGETYLYGVWLATAKRASSVAASVAASAPRPFGPLVSGTEATVARCR